MLMNGNCYKMLSYVFLSALMLLSIHSCAHEELPNGQVPDRNKEHESGVDLVMSFDVNQLQAALELQGATKADERDPIQNAAIQNMTSLAVFIINEEGTMVAYRVIGSCDDADRDNIWFITKNPSKKLGDDGYINETYGGKDLKNYKGGKGHIGDAIMGDWPDRFNNFYGITTNDEFYNKGTNNQRPDDDYYHDDEHYGCWKMENGVPIRVLEDKCVGYNGFARMGNDNEIEHNPDYAGANMPDFDFDGMYDEDYSSGDFTAYQKGERMRKSGAIILTFLHDNPMHGPIEALKRGNYKVYAIANFREVISPGVGQGDDGKFKRKEDLNAKGGEINYVGDFVYYLMYKWDPVNGIKKEEYAPFFAGALCMSELVIDVDGNIVEDSANPSPFVRSKRARILSTNNANIVLTPGNTNINTYPLYRIANRATFKVTNYSSEDLTVSGFSLSDNFAQGAVLLFDKDYEERFRDDWRKNGGPDVYSTKAITPFGTWTTDESGGMKKERDDVIIAGGDTKTIFDALLYESGDADDPLGYMLTASYGEMSKALGTIIPETLASVNEYSEKTYSDIYNSSNETYTFALKERREGFIYYDSNSDAKIKTKSEIQKIEDLYGYSIDEFYNFIWILEVSKNNDNISCKVKNKGRGDNAYLTIPNTVGETSYMDFSDEGTVFTLKEGINDYSGRIAFTTTSNGSLMLMNSLANKNICWGTWDDIGSYFSPYLIDLNQLSMNPEEQIYYPINAYDKTTGLAEPLHYFKRNMHLFVDISVTYNKETGQVEFSVSDWTEKDAEIEFN